MLEELEWKTRKERIDKKLKTLKPGWNIIKYGEGTDTSTLLCHSVTEYPTENGPADYAFFVKGKLLWILEAKKVSVNPQNVLEQAKRYSRGAFDGSGNWDGYRVPFFTRQMEKLSGFLMSGIARIFAGKSPISTRQMPLKNS
jgi:type I restriction enzyme R subunit